MNNTQLGSSANAKSTKKGKKLVDTKSFLQLLGSNTRSASAQRSNRAPSASSRTVDRGRASTSTSSRAKDNEVLLVTEDFEKLTTELSFLLSSDGKNFFYYSFV